VPTIAALTVGGTVLLGATRQRSGAASTATRRAVAVAAAVLLLADVAVLVDTSTRGWDRPAIVGNVASNADWQRIGREVARRVGHDPVAVRGEIGALAYGCDCEALDAFSDRGIDVPLVEDAIGESGAVTRPLLRANYRRFDRSQLPVVPRWVLEDHDGPPRHPDDLGYTNLGDGSARHLTLRRSPATPAAVGAAARAIRRGVPRDRTVVLHPDSGVTDSLDAEVWSAGIAGALRDTRIPVALSSASSTGTDVTVATGDGVTQAFERGTPRVLHYRGNVPLRRRIELGARRRRLERRHRQGKLSDVEFFTAMVRLQHEIVDEVLVYRTRR
jgi:hypothetical protein